MRDLEAHALPLGGLAVPLENPMETHSRSLVFKQFPALPGKPLIFANKQFMLAGAVVLKAEDFPTDWRHASWSTLSMTIPRS